MESLGDKLRVARENKGYSYEHVGRETNIARRYLEALETEDFAKFPGEPYLLGFLRNYGEYLGLETDELLSLYKAIKIQEQPIPVEQLLKSSPGFPKFLVVLLIALPVLAFLAGSVYFIFLRPRTRGVESVQAQIPSEYILEGINMERRFYQGDTILIPIGNERFKVELREMADPLALVVPNGRAELSLGGNTDLDLDGDGFADIRVTLADYDRTSPLSGALIRFDTSLQPAAAAGENAVPSGAQNQNTVIFSSSTAYPFTLQAQFQGYCMFRWEIDRRDRSERYFSRTDEISIQAQNGIRLWVSNAAAVRLQIIGAGRTVPLEIGAAGEVVVVDLRWLRDEDGRFRLVQYRLE
ncbi:MAG: helix-turn-helix domain-containing protein [Treponema sp.]|nr:helix-turn-helix domain-containing protein [Treponema sp.]